MNIIKQYLVECILEASKNLYLSSDNSRVLSLLRRTIIQSFDLKNDINEMKKKTDLAKLAIKMGEIQRYLTKTKIDFHKFSDVFTEHTNLLIPVVKELLESVDSVEFSKIQEELSENAKQQKNAKIIDVIGKPKEQPNKSAEIVLGQKLKVIHPKPDSNPIRKELSKISPEYTETFMAQIKAIDAMLKRWQKAEFYQQEIKYFSELMGENVSFLEKKKTENLANLFRIVGATLFLVLRKDIVADKDIIESLRAALIVIVASLRKKDVDIEAYQKRTETLETKLGQLMERNVS